MTRRRAGDQRLGRFASALAVPGVSSYGEWRAFTWDNKGRVQHGVELVPAHAPWRELFAAFDVAGKDLAAEPVAVEDEAAAIVACCLRYGTYFHVMTGGEYFPDFARDDALSRISDDEMKRTNIEFSSALTQWWGERAADPNKISRRTRAALDLLPITWDADSTIVQLRAESLCEVLRRATKDGSLASSPPASLRQAANFSVVRAYRNGPIEDLHAGTWSAGTEIPGFVRLYAGEVRQICSNATTVLGSIMLARGDPKVAQVFDKAAALAAPADWSLTEETATVRFHGLPEAGPLHDRLRILASRSPALFSAPSVL